MTRHFNPGTETVVLFGGEGYNGPCRLTRDGPVVQDFQTVNAALKYLHDNTSYSWAHAFLHEGWSLEKITEVEA